MLSVNKACAHVSLSSFYHLSFLLSVICVSIIYLHHPHLSTQHLFNLPSSGADSSVSDPSGMTRAHSSTLSLSVFSSQIKHSFPSPIYKPILSSLTRLDVGLLQYTLFQSQFSLQNDIFYVFSVVFSLLEYQCVYVCVQSLTHRIGWIWFKYHTHVRKSQKLNYLSQKDYPQHIIDIKYRIRSMQEHIQSSLWVYVFVEGQNFYLKDESLAAAWFHTRNQEILHLSPPRHRTGFLCVAYIP